MIAPIGLENSSTLQIAGDNRTLKTQPNGQGTCQPGDLPDTNRYCRYNRASGLREDFHQRRETVKPMARDN